MKKMSDAQIAFTMLVVERRMSLLRDARSSLENASRELARLDTINAAEMLEREILKENRIPFSGLENSG